MQSISLDINAFFAWLTTSHAPNTVIVYTRALRHMLDAGIDPSAVDAVRAYAAQLSPQVYRHLQAALKHLRRYARAQGGDLPLALHRADAPLAIECVPGHDENTDIERPTKLLGLPVRMASGTLPPAAGMPVDVRWLGRWLLGCNLRVPQLAGIQYSVVSAMQVVADWHTGEMRAGWKIGPYQLGAQQEPWLLSTMRWGYPAWMAAHDAPPPEGYLFPDQPDTCVARAPWRLRHDLA